MFWIIAPFLLFTSLLPLEAISPLLTDSTHPEVYEGKVDVVTGRFYDEMCDLTLTGASSLEWHRCSLDEPNMFKVLATGWRMHASCPRNAVGFSLQNWNPVPSAVQGASPISHLPAGANKAGKALVELRSPADLNWSLPLAKGRILTYFYDEQMRLQKLTCSDMSRNHELGYLRFEYDTEGNSCTVIGGDTQEVRYLIGPRRQLVGVLHNGEVVCTYEYGAEGLFRYSGDDSSAHIVRKAWRSGRYLEVGYYAAGDNTVGNRKIYLEGRLPYSGRNKRCDHPTTGRVRELFEPVGSGEKPVVTAQFFYNYNFNKEGGAAYSGGSTDVLDAAGNRTHYDYDGNGNVYRRSYFQGEGQPICTEGYHCIGGSPFHRQKTVYDAQDQPIAVMRSTFDRKGNLIGNELWGQLTSHSAPQLKVREDGEVLDGECHKVTYTYEPCFGNNSRCTSKSDGTTRCDYSYVGATNLIASELRSTEGKISHRRFVQYNSDGVAIVEIEDNGSGLVEEDLTDVTERTIQRTTPLVDENQVGLPRRIEWHKWEVASGQERLIKAVEYERNKHNLVTEKKIFDEQNEVKNTIVTQYDEKEWKVLSKTKHGDQKTQRIWDEATGLLKEKIGPAENQRSVYTYDKMGRLVQTVEYQGDTVEARIEQHYDPRGNCVEKKERDGKIILSTYDAMNRLVKEETTVGKVTTWTCYEYNALGYPIREEHSDELVILRQFNIRGQVTLESSSKGENNAFEYDSSGQLLGCRQADGALVEGKPRPIPNQVWNCGGRIASPDDPAQQPQAAEAAPSPEVEKSEEKSAKSSKAMVRIQGRASGPSGGGGSGEMATSEGLKGQIQKDETKSGPQRRTSIPAGERTHRPRPRVASEIAELRLDDELLEQELLLEEEQLASAEPPAAAPGDSS